MVTVWLVEYISMQRSLSMDLWCRDRNSFEVASRSARYCRNNILAKILVSAQYLGMYSQGYRGNP